MKIFLKVPIVCSVDKSEGSIDYESLGIKINGVHETETRGGGIKIDKISSWYPNVDKSATIVELGSDVYIVDMLIKDFEDLINEFITNPSSKEEFI